LTTNIGLSLKYLILTNTLAFYGTGLFMTIKSLIVEGYDPKLKKNITHVSVDVA
jgi:hypothetical protein